MTLEQTKEQVLIIYILLLTKAYGWYDKGTCEYEHGINYKLCSADIHPWRTAWVIETRKAWVIFSAEEGAAWGWD